MIYEREGKGLGGVIDTDRWATWGIFVLRIQEWIWKGRKLSSLCPSYCRCLKDTQIKLSNGILDICRVTISTDLPSIVFVYGFYPRKKLLLALPFTPTKCSSFAYKLYGHPGQAGQDWGLFVFNLEIRFLVLSVHR